MTTGDYVLWFGAFIFLLCTAGMCMSFLKLAQTNVKEWGGAALMTGVVYMCLVVAILSPTYYLVVKN